MAMILDLLRKAVCQASETAHPHTHCEILPFYETGRNVIRVRLSAQDSSTASDAGRGAVAALWGVARRAEYLDEHGIVDVAAEGLFDRISVHSVTVSSELDFIGDPAGQILHERVGRTGLASAD